MKTFTTDFLDIPISKIGLGTMIFHPDTLKRDFALLDAYVENGGTYIDTAEVYGAVEEHGFSEIVIGEWLKQNPNQRKKIVLATKGLITGYCAPLHPGGAKINPESIHNAILGSLARLQTDYLDIWMFHRDDLSQPVGPLIDALDEEVKQGRIKSYGASNWSVARINEAIQYAKNNNKIPMSSSSPHFSLAKANEPYWPETEILSPEDQKWYTQHNFMTVAWSSLGRGFFAHADPNDKSDSDLVRVFYSKENFTRKDRAIKLSQHKGLSMFEVVLAYVINQPFPVVALTGAQTPEEVKTSTLAGGVDLSEAECQWLDLRSDNKPF